MPTKLSIDAIRTRAAKLAKDFQGVTSEKQRDQDFMREFCHVFGVNPNRMQWQFKLKDGKTTRWADGVLPGMALFEIKSAGEDLEDAYDQAARYVARMQDADVPQLIIISDFTNIHVYHGSKRTDIKLADLPNQAEALLLLAGYEAIAIKRQNAANEAAAEKIGKLHDLMKANGYRGRDLETYLVRLLFCLFADDTGLFGERDSFLRLLENTRPDGTDLHGELEYLFNTLNKDIADRPKNLPERFAGFPYVNGDLFAERLSEPYHFDEASRALLLELAEDDWATIDPSIFGSLFQAIMHHDDEKAGKSKKRRELGAHYTSEANILKVIQPLFLDELWAEFEKIKSNKKALSVFHDKLANMQLLDPACGCGNFLVVAYRELRLLELEVIRKLYTNKSGQVGDVSLLARLDVDQFHGIEIDSTAARIAVVALWLTDHQMNMRLQELGVYYHRLPLKKRANIVCANALKIDWNEVIPAEKLSHILGNPPFIGSKMMTPEQRQDLLSVAGKLKGAGILDYVCGWYLKAATYLDELPTRVAFVSTNSITQGEQVGVLWNEMLHRGFRIFFAHRTFQWNNEARGVAAVHCVIIGFSRNDIFPKRLFDYQDIRGEPIEQSTQRINPYLVDGADIVLEKRSKPISDVVEMNKGSQPTDGGNLLMNDAEKSALVTKFPFTDSWVRKYVGAEEFINSISRWCLWLKDCFPEELLKVPEVLLRIEGVKQSRSSSKKAATRNWAIYPTLFTEDRQPVESYLLIPSVSSERRRYIPIGFMSPNVVASNLVLIIPNATLFHFGIMTSTQHMAWVRTVCGRLKSDYRYSAGIVYNNFPWPEIHDDKHRNAIEAAAQGVLDAREQFPDSTLADLYDPITMPPELTKAHQKLDKAVDAAYIAAEKAAGRPTPKLGSDAERVAFLFDLYQRYTSLLPTETGTAKTRRKKTTSKPEA